MSALSFVSALFETGRVLVGVSPQPPEGLADAVRELDRVSRLDMALEPPALAPAVGEWALLLLYRACQSLVYREIPAEAVLDALSRPCPAELSPAAYYSADLALAYLPDLLRLAGGIAAEDPLVTELTSLAKKWPLSSVGIKDMGDVDVGGFIGHPSLRRLYADRIIERGDVSRLNDPRVREAVRESLGAFPELAPKLADAIGKRT